MYARILAEVVKEDCDRVTPRTKDDIAKDLNRTKTTARVQTAEGQAELERVLLAVAYCVPDISYCQGMNYIAAVLLTVMDSEARAFLIFMHLILNKQLKPLFLSVSYNLLRLASVGRA